MWLRPQFVTGTIFGFSCKQVYAIQHIATTEKYEIMFPLLSLIAMG